MTTFGRIANGYFYGAFDRGSYWNVEATIRKGSYGQLRAEGLAALTRRFAAALPEFADRIAQIEDWKALSLLSVETGRVRRWWRPGLLLIGDAAHIISPAVGAGINYAIQDAVVAANVLAKPLRAGRLRLGDLAAVQRRREWPTRAIQALQAQVQGLVIETALRSDRPLQPPAFLRLPLIRAIPPRIIGFGVWPVHLAPELRAPAVQPTGAPRSSS